MSETSFACSKCNGEMIKGFAADRSGNYYMNLAWVDGEPEKAEVFGLKGDNVKLRERPRFIVRGLRCIKCGYLELYAI